METFGLFWSVKYLNFQQELPIRTAHPIFLESRHPEVTKNPYYVVSPKDNQKKVSADGLIPVCRVSISTILKSIPPHSTVLPFLKIINPYVRINKIVNKHTVDYRLSYLYRVHISMDSLFLQSLS